MSYIVTVQHKDKADADDARYTNNTVYSQLFEILDLPKLVVFLNQQQLSTAEERLRSLTR